MRTSWQQLVKADPEAAEEIFRAAKEAVFVPHGGGQRDVMLSDARFRVVRAGRRYGKTKLAAHEAVTNALSGPERMVWWISNSDKNVRRGYREVIRQLPGVLLAKPPPSENANDRILTLENGSRIEFYTAGSAQSAASDSSALTGEGVDFLVVDEAGLMPDSVWYQYLRPTLSDTAGRALIISTPRGRNWFHTLCDRGERGDPLYQSWHFCTVDNPYIAASEVEDARATLPDIIFRQEYEAEFVANAASMFILPPASIVPALVEPLGQISLGVDLAKKEDFTVLSASRVEDRLPCFHDRFKEVSWPIQEEHIMDAVRWLEAQPGVEGVVVSIDSTGIGDVVYDHLEDRGLDVEPVNFSGGWKERAVRRLATDLENGEAFILEDQRIEFESYEYKITPGGRYTFAAATGHDDEVSAKLLEHWGAHEAAAPTIRIIDGNDSVDEDDGDEEPMIAASPDDLMARDEVWSTLQDWRRGY